MSLLIRSKPRVEIPAAIVDRLTYNAHIIETGTESFRLAQASAHTQAIDQGK